jgi:hypothetical protein
MHDKFCQSFAGVGHLASACGKEKTAKLYSTYIATVGLALYLNGHRPAFLEGL